MAFLNNKSLFPALGIDRLPMSTSNSFEGTVGRELDRGFSPSTLKPLAKRVFPSQTEDPIVNFSLVSPLTEGGAVALSAIVKPNFERELLLLLYRLLSNLGGACLLTYNGLRFDVKYVVQRGGLYDLNFEDVFENFCHVDVYRLLKWLDVGFPRYGQKTVERCLGVVRAIRHVSGGNYRLIYNDFVRISNLPPMFYNIVDSFGCLRIAGNVRSLLARRRGMS